MSDLPVRQSQLRKDLVSATTLEDISSVVDKAETLRVLAKRIGASLKTQNEIAETRLRAERRGGEMLRDGKKSGDRQKQGEYQKLQSATFGIPPSLKEIGIEKTQAHRWQKLASIPDAEWERIMRETLEVQDEELARALFLRWAKEQDKQERRATRLNTKTQTCTVDDLQKLIEQGQKFGTIYVDPPWSYGNQATRSATDNHYETLTLEEIAAHPIPELAADECHLHLWTTNAFLHDSFHLLEQWGFEFKSLLVWDKDKLGIGNYWRLQTEYLLLGVKGNLTFLDHSQPNIVRGARTKHSAKPKQVRRMIEKVSPGPRLEMFARRISNGWVAWGNEIERTMFDADVKEVV